MRPWRTADRGESLPIRYCIRLAYVSIAQPWRISRTKFTIPTGRGALTLSLIDGEVCQWERFAHPKAVASYTGCCPSEHSSGPIQRFGAIDRHGNKHLRVLLVEAVWRLLKWQPGWHARQKYLLKLRHGAKKKIAMALARQLAIDLWRWRTGRANTQELGWSLPKAAEQPKPVLVFTKATSQAKCAPRWNAARRCS